MISTNAPTGQQAYGSNIQAPASKPIDLFSQNGGLGGLFGLTTPLAPGTYNLNTLLGMPPKSSTPVPQFSQEQATHNLSSQLAGIANGTNGQTSASTSPLSPTNTSNNTKGGGSTSPNVGMSSTPSTKPLFYR